MGSRTPNGPYRTAASALEYSDSTGNDRDESYKNAEFCPQTPSF
jgi:hypothetical protein